VIAAARQIPLLVLVLASRTGWQEEKILDLPVQRLLRYLDKIKPEKTP